MRIRTKKRLIIGCICIIVFLFLSMFIVLFFDDKYLNDIKNDIEKNTGINDIKYVNMYNNSYIVIDSKYLYLFDLDYVEITKIDVSLISENKKNYDIVYKDKTIMYMNNYKDKNGIVIEYYSIYDYELINKIVVGGN